ncbi:putative glycolipid transfer protein [Plasmopara halstedii]
MGEASAPAVVTTSSPVVTSPGVSPAFALSSSRTGRNLRKKMVDELKNVKLRRSPAHKEKHSTRGTPPVLELNESADDEEEDVVQDPHAIGKGKGCNICERSFTVFRAKHTCKMCAQKICDDCSKNRMKLNRRLERKRGSRLCDPCAKSYLHIDTGSGDDTALPDVSPALPSVHCDDVLTQNGEVTNKLSRQHSVPSRTLTSLIHTKDKLSDPDVVLSTKQYRFSQSKANERVLHVSHLRMRHWLSLGIVAVLVTLRVIHYNCSVDVNRSAVASDTGLAAPTYSFVEHALDELLSMRTLGTYLLGLILFDELSRPKSSKMGSKQRRKAKRRRSSIEHLHNTKPILSELSVANQRDAVESSAPSSPHTSQDDDLEVTLIESNQEDEIFTLEKLVLSLEEGARTRAPDGNLGLGCFMATCNVICGFLGVFGRATSFAGSTVGAYFTAIEHNTEAWSVPASSDTWKQQSVKAVVDHEVSLGVADVGGKKKPSCSRCLLRLLWFVQFVEACIRLTLLESTDEDCYNGASKAYEETLGKRHPWLVRKGVNTALGSIPTRSHILSELHVGEGDAMEILAQVHSDLVRVIAELKIVFEEHGLTDLK